MEMVSRDMKSLGMYLSGSISFGVDPVSGKAVEYRERVHPLTPEQRKMYNHAARAWQAVLQNIWEAIEITNAGRRSAAIALQKFWGDHQRFFRQVICAFKVPSVIAEAEAALGEGKSVVISIGCCLSGDLNLSGMGLLPRILTQRDCLQLALVIRSLVRPLRKWRP